MTRLHHVNVVVAPGSTDDVAHFYVEVLGLRRAAKPSEGTAAGGAWFDVDQGCQVHVSERPDAEAHPDQHFALVVDDFARTLRRLEEIGAEWHEQADLFGGRRGWTRDPAGNRIEILERAGSLRD